MVHGISFGCSQKAQFTAAGPEKMRLGLAAG